MGTAVINEHHFNKVIARYKKYFEDSIRLLFTSKKGLKPEAVFDFLSVSKLSGLQVERLLNKTMKTFNNYKEGNILLDATTSEKLLKLFTLYDKGMQVFGNVKEFNLWLGEPSFGLGGEVPLSILTTITGTDLVVEELRRIEYGDLA